MSIGLIFYFIVGLILFFPVNFSKEGIILVDSIVPNIIPYYKWGLFVIFWLPVIIKNHIRNLFF